MSEDRARWERFSELMDEACRDAHPADKKLLWAVKEAIDFALAAPPPDAAPELPGWMTQTVSGHWHVLLSDGSYYWLHGDATSADLDRIAEACRILAARRRAEG